MSEATGSVEPHATPAYLRTILRDQAIRRNDCEPLTRADIQYDMLKCIFEDTRAVFTNIPPRGPQGNKATFRDLYIYTLLASPLATRTLREQVARYPEFATDFAKIALLVNVGRINTKMAFFPEMTTTLRTYHPVPSLSRTGGNLQDAPRIRKMLKASQLGDEAKADLTLGDILTRSRSGQIPPTTIINLIFTMINYSRQISQTHFDDSLEFHELFHPVNISSSSRAQAFLWLCYHYMEAPSSNPFDDEYSKQNPGKVPLLMPLSEEEKCKQNVDSVDEITLGEQCAQKRQKILTNREETITGSNSDNKHKGKGSGTPKKTQSPKRTVEFVGGASPSPEPPRPPARRPRAHSPTVRHSSIGHDNLDRNLRNSTQGGHVPRLRRRSSMPDVIRPETSFLQYAWQSISTVDPLLDSDDDDDDARDHTRREYVERLRIVTRLRGQSPTPESPDAVEPMEIDSRRRTRH